MKTYSSIDYTSEQPTVCALGCFDGVHIGHASIIKKAKEIATKSSALCAVWSFSEPPKNFFAKEKTKTPSQVGWRLATRNGLEPSTSSVTGWRANRLHHRARWRSANKGIIPDTSRFVNTFFHFS